MTASSEDTEISIPVKAWYRWGVVAQLWFVCFLNYADRQAIYTVFPLIRRDLHLTSTQLGLLGSSFMWMYAFTGPFAGWLSDRLRRKWIIIVALAFWSLMTAATAFAPNFRWLLCVRVLGGLGEAFYFPAALALIGEFHPRQTRSRAMSLHQTGVYVGTVAGGTLSGILAERAGWHGSFVAFGAAGLALSVVLCFSLREHVTGERVTAQKFSREVLTSLLSNRQAVALTCMFVGANFVAAVFLTWLPTYMWQTMGLSIAAAGFNSTIYLQGASVVGVALGGLTADRLVQRRAGGRMLTQAIGLACGTPFLFVIGRTHALPLLLLALAGFGLCKGLYDSNIWASLYDTIPVSQRGVAAGAMNSVGWIGGGVAPLAVAFASRYVGMGTAISSTAAIYLVLAIGMAVLGRTFVSRQGVQQESQVQVGSN